MWKPKGLLRGLALLSVFLYLVSCHKNNGKDDSPGPVNSLTQDIYTIDSQGLSMPGIILAAPFQLSLAPKADSPALLLIMDQNGKVLQKKTTPGSAFNLERWVINGQTRLTYFVNDRDALHAFNTDNNSGYVIIADSNLNELQRVDFTPFGNGLFQPGQALDSHDFVLISDNDYITLSYDIKRVGNIPARFNPAPGEPVVSPLIEEVKNGSVVWSWEGSADTSFYASSVQGNDFSDTTVAQDYMHMNSLFVDPTDNNLICSMRNQCQVIKINRQTGAVMWRLGGRNSDFPLSSDEAFLYQHHATLVDNNQTLLLFDDGDATLRPYSRILEFHLDQVGKTVTSFKYYNIPEPISLIMGSVQKIGKEYFIGGGSANYILEINYLTGQKVREFKGTQTTYRAFKYNTMN